MIAPPLPDLEYITNCARCDALYAPGRGDCPFCEPRESRPCMVCSAVHDSAYALCQACRTDERTCTEDGCCAVFHSPCAYIATSCPTHHADERVCTEGGCGRSFFINREFSTTCCPPCVAAATKLRHDDERVCQRCNDIYTCPSGSTLVYCPRCRYVTRGCEECGQFSQKPRGSEFPDCRKCKKKDPQPKTKVKPPPPPLNLEELFYGDRELCRKPSAWKCRGCGAVYNCEKPKRCLRCERPQRPCVVCGTLTRSSRGATKVRCPSCKRKARCATCDEWFSKPMRYAMECQACRLPRGTCPWCDEHGPKYGSKDWADGILGCKLHRLRRITPDELAQRTRDAAARRKQREDDASIHGGVPTLTDKQRLWLDPCAYCGKQSEHADHIRALSRGGWNHLLLNMVGACSPCNRRKINYLLTEWRDVARVMHGVKHDLRIAQQYAREVAEMHGYDMSWWVPTMEPIHTDLTLPEKVLPAAVVGDWGPEVSRGISVWKYKQQIGVAA